MTRRDDQNLDRAIEEIRNEPIDAEDLRAAADRVRQRLEAVSPALVEGCAGYQALFPAYLRGEVSPSRTLLLDDHVRECVACRKALREARAPRPVSVRELPVGVDRRGTARIARWAAAAVVLIGLGFGAYALRDRLVPPALAATGTIQSLDGTLYRVDGGAMRPVAVGETVGRGERIRAGRDGGAVVRLADGSQVEMRERSELALSREGDGVAVDLAMGSVLVQAAPQGRGHLYVRSDDCLVAVRGTIFAVSSDLKGSKVSVVEGQVEVRFGEEALRLDPGQQAVTSASLEKTSVESEVAWSRDVDRYLALLGELRALQKQMDSDVTRPGVRTSTRLLDLAPEGTVFYAAIPNVSTSLAEAHRILREKVASSPVLQEWWARKVAPLGGEAAVDDALDRLRTVGDQLGDEIAVTFQKDAGGERRSPLVLAEVRHPDALRAALDAEIDRAGRLTGKRSFARVLSDADLAAGSMPASAHDTMLFWVRDDLLVASPDLDAVRRVAAATASAPGAFARSGFHDRLADAYRDGVGWLLGVDLHAILEGGGVNRERLEPTGVLDAEHLIVEAREEDGQLRDAAVLTFDQPRRGVASWLASPGPMGSLRYISPDASLAAGFVVKDPAAMVGDAMALLKASDPDFDRHLDEASRETGIDVARDLAAPLGGEIAFAIDGPILPFPAWKLVVEVHDASRLQDTIERLVARASSTVRPSAVVAGLTVDKEQVGDRTFYTLRSEQPKLEVHYLFTDGYLVAAPQRVLLERAMQQAASHYDLASSPKFTALLPRDARTSFSAIAYQNLGALIPPLAKGIAGNVEGLTPEQRRSLDQYSAGSPAGLAYAYAERDRIVFGGGRSGGVVSLLGSLLGLDQPQALEEVVGELSRRSSGSATTQ